MLNIYYSVIGAVALIIHSIINHDIIFSRNSEESGISGKSFRRFTLSVISFYIVDIIWGICAEIGNRYVIYSVTTLYFLFLAVICVCWDLFVIDYLSIRGKKKALYAVAGYIISFGIILLLLLNDFNHLFFWIDDDGVYQTGSFRTVILLAQILFFFVTSFRAAQTAVRYKGNIFKRHIVIFFFGITMMVGCAVQIFAPLLPIYSMGFVIGCCLIHTFVVEDEKEEMRKMLEREKNIAEKSNEAKTSFLFSMSHDIRTPMNAIMGYTELAKKVENNPEKTKEYLAKIEVAEDNLLGLINNVLEMARIENGAIVKNERPSDISLDVNKTITIFEGMAKEKNITLTGHSDIYNPYVMEDEKLDAQIAVNIVSNAIKYTNEGGKVDVYLKQLPGNDDNECIIEFKVVDTGIGMSKEFLEHAFDNFTRENTSTDSKIQGVGLGLGIVKKLIDQMGGTIHIDSEKGVGTTVTVHTHHRFCDKEQVYAPVSLENPGDARFDGHRLLLVEDNELNMEIAMGVLGELGVEAETAVNGKEACEILLQKGAGYYEMVLMDIQMPVMNGYEATREIRSFADDKLRNIPIVAMTANAFEEDQKNALTAGMNGHLAKPINLSQLVAALKRYLTD